MIEKFLTICLPHDSLPQIGKKFFRVETGLILAKSRQYIFGISEFLDNITQRFHFSKVTKLHDLSRIFKKIPGMFQPAFIYIFYSRFSMEALKHFGPALTWSASTVVDPKRGIFVFQFFPDYLHFSRIQYNKITKFHDLSRT